MSLRDRIDKLKAKKLEDSLGQAKQRGIVEVPLDLIERVVKKLDTIEEGAEKNKTKKQITEIINSIKINAETLEGMRSDDFSIKTHTHSEFEHIFTKDNFREFKRQFDDDTAKIANNLISLFGDIDKIRNDSNYESKIEKIKKQLEDVSKEVKLVKKIRDLVSKEQLKKEIVQLEKTLKDYTNMMAQRAAGMSRGGGGPYVQDIPPTNPAFGATWVDTSA